MALSGSSATLSASEQRSGAPFGERGLVLPSLPRSVDSLLLSAGLVVVLASLATAQDVWMVPGDYPRIQLAVDAATPGDTVLVGPGVYFENVIVSGKDITIRSTDGAGSTTVSGILQTLGPDLLSVFRFENVTAECRLEGFTLEDGAGGPQGGGGIFVSDGSPTLVELVVRDNSTMLGNQPGAGLRVFGGGSGSMLIENCHFVNNDGGEGTVSVEGLAAITVRGCEFRDNFVDLAGGGGLYVESCPAVRVENSLFETNEVFLGGGGIATSNSSGEVVACTFRENDASVIGAGLLVIQSTLAVLDCRFEGNTAGNAAAIALDTGDVTVERCVFHGNTADNRGGAVGSAVNPDTCTIRNCTFFGNTGLGGGDDLTINDNSAFMVENSIFWATGPMPFLVLGTLSVTYSDVEGGFPGIGNIDADPMFVNPAIGDFQLLPGSPCIDAGNPLGPPDPDGTIADMGATSAPSRFLRGDSNGDGTFDVSDVLFTLASIFVPGAPPPGCPDAADANDDGGVDISDAIFSLAALFIPGSPSLPTPSGACGFDPTTDSLTCPPESSPCG